MLNQLREDGLAKVHASLSCLSENGSEMGRFSQIRFKSFPTTIAISPAGTVDYSYSSIFPRTAVHLEPDPVLVVEHYSVSHAAALLPKIGNGNRLGLE